MQLLKIHIYGTIRSQYDVQNAFSEGLLKALQKLGHLPQLFLFSKQVDVEALTKTRPDISVGFNFLPTNLSPHLFSPPVPHVAMMIDCASYFPMLINAKNSLVTFVDNDSVHFFTLHGAKNVFYLPHAIEESAIIPHNTPRDLDIVMCGSYIDSQDAFIKLKNLVTPKTFDKLLEIAQNTLLSPTYSHRTAVYTLATHDVDFQEELEAKKISYFNLINYLDLYIRAIDRQTLIENIDHPIHIFGAKQYESEWKNSIKTSSKLIFEDSVPYSQLPSILQRSRLVINSVPVYKQSTHERLLLSLASGASVISNETIFINQQFPTGILNYTFPHFTNINTLIQSTLKNEEERHSEVLKTHPTLRTNHTWDVRAKQLIEICHFILPKIRQQ